jgi:cytochrome c
MIACNQSKSPKTKVPKEKPVKIQKPKPSTTSNASVDMSSLGGRLYILCDACHSLSKGEAHKTGPNLHGLFGKEAGTAEGFAYSDAIKNSGIIWDEQHLKNWLSDPDGYIPGTAMAFIGISDEEKQNALIYYLKENTK